MGYQREKLLQQAKEGAGSVQAEFTSPKEDWAPILLLSTRRGIQALALDWSLFRDEVGKERLAGQITRTIRNKSPYAVALVMSAWQSNLTPAQSLAALAGAPIDSRASDDPKRREVLLIEVSDHVEDELHLAEIRRHRDRPPTLGEWKRIDGMTGRFAEAIAAGFGREPTPPRHKPPQG